MSWILGYLLKWHWKLNLDFFNKIEILAPSCSTWHGIIWGQLLKVLANIIMPFWGFNVAHLVLFGPIWSCLVPFGSFYPQTFTPKYDILGKQVKKNAQIYEKVIRISVSTTIYPKMIMNQNVKIASNATLICRHMVAA